VSAPADFMIRGDDNTAAIPLIVLGGIISWTM
jgi:hypothetical protein